MPGDNPNPFDSYNRRLGGEMKRASREQEAADASAAETADSPFDSYTGRLEDAVQASAAAPEPVQVPGVAEDEWQATDGLAPDELRQDELDLAESGVPVQTESPTPDGYKRHVVRDGDCVTSIAHRHGFFWETVWNDSANAELKEKRSSPDVLFEGDVVFVRDLRRKDESGETEQVHRFKRRGEPARVTLTILHRDEPRADEPYRLIVDGREEAGALDAEGTLDVFVPSTAKDAELYVGEGLEETRYDLDLGSLSPIDTIRGIQERLTNLGLDCGGVTDRMNAATRGSLARFQKKHDLEVHGCADPGTRERLEEIHGS